MTDSSQDRFHVDKALFALGPVGRYQILHTVLAFLAQFPSWYQLLVHVFISRTVSHKCAAPDNMTTSFLDAYVNSTNITVSYGECSIVVWSNCKKLREEACVFGIEYETPKLTSVVSTFDLVCDKSVLNQLPQTLLIIGQGIGAVITMIVSDRYGRKLALVGSNFGMLVCSVVIGLAPNYVVFAVFKFFVGAFQQGCTGGLNTFTLELFPSKERRILAVYNVFSTLVVLVPMSLYAYLLQDYSWRYLQLLLSSFSLLALIQMWLMDDSLRWLVANGKGEKALSCLKRAARMNRKNYPDIIKAFQSVGEPTENSDAEVLTSSNLMEEVDVKTDIQKATTRPLTLLDLLRIRRLFINALCIWFAWFTTALGYFALYLTSSSLVGSLYVNFFLLGLFNLPADLLRFLCLNRIGRKGTLVLMFALMGGNILTSGIFKRFEVDIPVFKNLTVVSYLLGITGASGCFDMLFFYTPEMFPVNIRNQAVGVSSFMGRIGGMLAPFTGILAAHAIWGPGVLIGGCAVVMALLLKFAPETMEKEMPQTVEELQAWFIKDRKAAEKLLNKI